MISFASIPCDFFFWNCSWVDVDVDPDLCCHMASLVHNGEAHNLWSDAFWFLRPRNAFKNNVADTITRLIPLCHYLHVYGAFTVSYLTE